jgi:hypothetical protein
VFDLEGAAMETSLGIWAFGPMVTRLGSRSPLDPLADQPDGHVAMREHLGVTVVVGLERDRVRWNRLLSSLTRRSERSQDFGFAPRELGYRAFVFPHKRR